MFDKLYTLRAASEYGEVELLDDHIVFTAEKGFDEAFFRLEVDFPSWEEDAYVMLPACAYNGNRFPRVKRRYPPMYRPEECQMDMLPITADIPALEPDGSGEIEVTSGDMATPCAAVFFRRAKRGFLLFTEQEIKEKNLGFSVRAGHIAVSYPKKRTKSYRHCRAYAENIDQGIAVSAGETLSSAFRIFEFPCEDIPSLFEVYFEKRKCVMSSPRPENGYTENLWKLMEWHFNAHNWSGEYYAEATKTWQCGWCGGGMSSLALLKLGTVQTKARARKTVDFLCEHQFESGFFMSIIRDGVYEDDSFHTEGFHDLHLVRKSADALYFLFKHFEIEEPKALWVDAARKCADAFVRLFETYGTFGQFINGRTGEMVVPCTSAGGMAIGALVKAHEYFGEKRYLDVAKAACTFYAENFILEGVTSGGPGEILAAPDSESAFAMLESCVVLYEAEKEEKWLKLAESCAHLCSSWVVTYAYKFPAESQFGKHRVNTVGSVFANAQNKHSAPGICTLSGDSLYKLWKFTKKREYLDLLLDIAYFIPRCVSGEDEPFFSWEDVPRPLPRGFVNERVNMSDWEGDAKIGAVFYGTCWCETSLALTFAELCDKADFMDPPPFME